jgi:hypothetical protein
MRFASRRPWLGVAVVAVAWLLPANGFGLTFSASCDRFEADGNEFGAAGGAFDFVDEFDDGTLSPGWAVLLGTAVEATGVVTAKNPGQALQLGPTAFEISTIENELHGVSNGSGDFTGVSHWAAALPTTDTEFHMQLYSIAPIVEAAGITVNNLSAAVAAQQGNGSLAGYSISQSVTQGVGSGFTTIHFDTVAIAPASITGPIVLRLSLDDATDMLTCSFSLDGGSTFQSPFPPMHVFNGGVSDYDVLLGAAALAPPPSLNLPLRLFEAKNPSVPEARKVRYSIQAPNTVPPNFGSPTTQGATLSVKLDGVSQCFHLPAPLWSTERGGFAFRYLDRSGLYGPVKQLTVRRNAHRVFQSKAQILGKLGTVNVVPQGTTIVGADLRLHLVGGTDFCASTTGGTVAANDGRKFRVRDAPAPGVCALPACSPSGAFLD